MTMIQPQKLAFLGLGVMGAPMTVNLARKGFSVTAWNRTPNSIGVETVQKVGVKVAQTLAEAVENADIILTCLGDVPDVKAVILGENGVIHHAKSNALIIDVSTIGRDAAQEIAQILRSDHLRFLDAPVSGGDIGAKQGTLTTMVGGTEADFQESLPYLQAMGKNIYYCGPSGSGQAVKLCNQVLAALNMVGLCEAIALAQEQNIDPNLMIEVCSTGAAGSWALANLGPKIVADDLNPGFMIKHILKDLRLVQETFKNSDKSFAGVELADRLFKIVQDLDNGKGAEQGTQAMIRAYQDKG
jgi:3-hydroxyisobutyrate dehydrogenase